MGAAEASGGRRSHVKHLASLVDGPTPERAQHNRVTRDKQTVADAAGNIGLPYRVEDLLGRLERKGDIGHRERTAGDEFGRLFNLAHLDPLRAADMTQPQRPQSSGGHVSERAKHQVYVALNALGGQASISGCCAWFVLGVELSVNQWALRQGIRREVAKGTLLATLSVLAGHFGK